ncbi:Kelch repeat-containing protein [Deminuibacter soli]|nr:kelch repeat-containing protein [Deminuibacter soli]
MKKSLVVLSTAAITLMAVSCSKSSGDSDETTGNWVSRSAFDGKPRGFAATFNIGDVVYVGTGFNYAELNGAIAYRDFWRYQPNIGQWELMAAVPGYGRSGAVGFSASGKGYIGLGNDSLSHAMNDFYQYDPTGNTWTAIAPFPATDGRYQAVAFGIKDTGYVGTGSNPGGSYRDFYKYDANANSWTQIESCPGDKRSGSSAFISADTAGYVVAGANTGSNALNTDFAYYKPADGHWHSLRPIFNKSSDSYDDDYSDIKRTQAAIFVIGSNAYLSTGAQTPGGTPFTKTWLYDIKNDQWTRRTPFEKQARTGAIGFSFSGRGFIGLGSASSSQQLDDIVEFQPNVTEDTND